MYCQQQAVKTDLLWCGKIENSVVLSEFYPKQVKNMVFWLHSNFAAMVRVRRRKRLYSLNLCGFYSILITSQDGQLLVEAVHSKCGHPQGCVGSNPTVSAKRPEDYSFGPFSFSVHLSPNCVAHTLIDCDAPQIFLIFLVIFDKLRAFFEKMV